MVTQRIVEETKALAIILLILFVCGEEEEEEKAFVERKRDIRYFLLSSNDLISSR